MVSRVLQNSVRAFHLHDCCNEYACHRMLSSSSCRVISKGFVADFKPLGKRTCVSAGCTIGVINASSSHKSVVNIVACSSHPTTNSGPKASIESALILIRHGESMWNEKNLFTGCVDVPLTVRGIEEAIEAGKRISNIPVDIMYTSALIRTQMTAMLAMTQHLSKKVPIILHDESDQAKEWGQISSEETRMESIQAITAWQLNERMYGELQGLNKKEIAERYGKHKVEEWRPSYEIPPLDGESLEMCSQRAVPYFREYIEPQLQSGKNVMVAAHLNTLRSIIMYLERLTSEEVKDVELSNGVPLLYIYNDRKFLRRGSLVGPAEAGVYAHTSVTIRRYRNITPSKESLSLVKTVSGSLDLIGAVQCQPKKHKRLDVYYRDWHCIENNSRKCQRVKKIEDQVGVSYLMSEFAVSSR